jgi:hypothetical protein
MSKTSNSILLKWFEMNGAVINEIPPAQLKKLKIKWRKTFSSNLNKIKGVWRLGGYDWHAFSYETIETITGNNAVAETLKHNDIKWFLWGDGSNEIGYIVAGITPINLTGLAEDYIITGFDYSWTAAFTHELECGPYYCAIG